MWFVLFRFPAIFLSVMYMYHIPIHVHNTVMLCAVSAAIKETDAVYAVPWMGFPLPPFRSASADTDINTLQYHHNYVAFVLCCMPNHSSCLIIDTLSIRRPNITGILGTEKCAVISVASSYISWEFDVDTWSTGKSVCPISSVLYHNKLFMLPRCGVAWY